MEMRGVFSKLNKYIENNMLEVEGDKIILNNKVAYVITATTFYKIDSKGFRTAVKDMGGRNCFVDMIIGEIKGIEENIILRLEKAASKQVKVGFNLRYPQLHENLLYKIKKLKEGEYKINREKNLQYSLIAKVGSMITGTQITKEGVSLKEVKNKVLSMDECRRIGEDFLK